MILIFQDKNETILDLVDFPRNNFSDNLNLLRRYIKKFERNRYLDQTKTSELKTVFTTSGKIHLKTKIEDTNSFKLYIEIIFPSLWISKSNIEKSQYFQYIRDIFTVKEIKIKIG